MREIAQSGPHGLQDAVPHRVGDQMPPQDPCRRRRQALASQDIGGNTILTRTYLKIVDGLNSPP
jgi:hypothetical protein